LATAHPAGAAFKELVVQIVKNVLFTVVFIIFSIVISALLPFLAVQYPVLGLILAGAVIFGFGRIFTNQKKKPQY
jgi:uncharacterized membrane-anchored protein